MTAPMVDYKIHWLKMMSVPESRAVVGRHDGINGRDSTKMMPDCPCSMQDRIRHIGAGSFAWPFWHRRSRERLLKGANPQG